MTDLGGTVPDMCLRHNASRYRAHRGNPKTDNYQTIPGSERDFSPGLEGYRGAGHASGH